MKKNFGKIFIMLVCTILCMLGTKNVYATELSAATVSNLQAVYDEQNDRITLSYAMPGAYYVTVYVNGAVDDADYTGTVYYFDDVQEGQTYTFKVEPYDATGLRGTAAEVTVTVGYKKAVLEEVDVDYDLEEKVLVVDWIGDNIAYVDVMQDSVLIADNASGDRYLATTFLQPKTKYVYTVVPYNTVGEVGAYKSFELTVDDYEASIEEISIVYDEKNCQLQMKWTDEYTDFVEIYLNEEMLVGDYREKTFVYSCELQPGAPYVLYILPYNDKKEEGEEYDEDISFGDFDIPSIVNVKLSSVDVMSSTGKNTGFSRPAADITWEAQARGIYEIYRAEKDKKSAYTWIATVTANETGKYTYTDSTVGIGKYYYKIRRKINEDVYNAQTLFSALSESDGVNITLPKPTVTAVLDENAVVNLTMNTTKDYVSGYEIYRKKSGGKFKKIAAISGNAYMDAEVEFDKNYYYKVRSFFCNPKNGKISYGKYSSKRKVKTTVGAIEAKAEQISQDKVKLTWNAAANAEGYEIYAKSNTQGDSYALLTTTTELEYVKKVSPSGSYSFMVKAYCENASGKIYFSSSEVVFKAGLTGPQGLEVQKVSYKWNKSTQTLTENTTLVWERVYGASGYYVEYYDTLKKKFKRLATVKKGTNTSYTVSNEVKKVTNTLNTVPNEVQKEQQPICYRIKAYNKDKVKTGATIEIKPNLGKVQKVSVSKIKSKLTVSWKKVAGAEGYRVYRSNGRHMTLIGETTTETKITDSGLSTGVEYEYYVEAYNKTLNLTGEKSDPVAYTAVFGKVSGFKVKKTKDGTVQLSWSAKKDAKTYRIYYTTEKDGEYQLLTKTSETGYVHMHPLKGLDKTEDNTIYYQIVAVHKNVAGIEILSKPVSANITIKGIKPATEEDTENPDKNTADDTNKNNPEKDTTEKTTEDKDKEDKTKTTEE